MQSFGIVNVDIEWLKGQEAVKNQRQQPYG